MIPRENAVIPVTPTADHSGKEGYFVKASGNNVALCSATTDLPLGVITEGAETASKDSVAVSRGGYKGTVKVKIGSSAGSVSFGGLLQLNNDGSVNPDAGTGSRVIVAQAIESGAANELVEAVIFTPYSLS